MKKPSEKIQKEEKAKYTDRMLSAYSLAEDLGITGPLFYNTLPPKKETKNDK